jgi:hypothetical protein
MKYLVITAVVLAISSCTSAGEYFAGSSTEVASCFNASGNATFAGQSNAATSGCKCQISPEAGLRVTEAAVSSDGTQCYMRVAPQVVPN